MLHTYPLTAWGILNKPGMVLMRAPEGTGDPNNLVLRVVIHEGPYLLGEPIPVHTMLINQTEAPITIPYGRGHQYAMVRFIIEGPDGDEIPRILERLVDTDGPGPLTIPPGQQFVHMMNLSGDYAIAKPGEYSVSAEYNSEGKYYEFDQELKRAVASPAWAGRLTADVGTIEVREPSQQDDRDALEKLLGGLTLHPAHKRYALVVSGVEANTLRHVIDEFPNSRYSDYARFRIAEYSLTHDRWQDRRYAPRALEPLEAIHRKQYPKLFQEMVLHRLILAHVGAGSDDATLRPLVEEFRQQFPDSPYELPDAAAQLAPAGP